LLRRTLAWQQAVALPEEAGDTALNLGRGQPADAVRWAAFTETTPAQAERDFLQPVWRLLGPLPAAPHTPDQDETRRGRLLDRWLRARLHRAIGLLTEALDQCKPQRAARALAAVVDDVLDWYAVLRPEGIGQMLGILCQLLAPFTPHMAEAIHRQAGKRVAESIHLATWPCPDPDWEDRGILYCMTLVRRLSALGQAARRRAGVEDGSLLRQAIVYLHDQEDGGAQELAPGRDLLAEVLGVNRVRFTPEAMAQVEWNLGLDAERAPERAVAPEAIEAALAGLGSAERQEMTSQLWYGLSVSVEVGGQAITLLPGDISLTARAQPGWAAAVADRLLVILETA
jgi:isoleucyl-tRNA synthetase